MSEKSKTRQSPHDLKAEKAVLGCLLLDKEAIYKTVHSLNINAFYDKRLVNEENIEGLIEFEIDYMDLAGNISKTM